MALVTWQLPLSLGEFCSPIQSSRFFLRLSMAVMCLSNSFRLFYSGVIGRGWGWWHFRALLVILAKRKADRWKGVCSIWLWPTWWTVPSSPSVSLEEPFEREQQTTPKTTGCVYVEEGEKTSTSSDRDFIFPGLDGKNILFRKKPDVFTLLIGWITIRSVAWEMSDSCYWLLLLVADPSIRLHPTITSLSCDEIYASCLL